MWHAGAMVGTQGGSTVARRQLGRRLRRLREQAGRSHDDVAETRLASRTKMWKIEHGHTAVKEGDVLALARLYEATPAEIDELVALAAATRVSGFVVDGSAIAPWIGPYADLEASCSVLQEYHCELIHGLLQTPDYARAVISANPDLSPEVVEQRVEFRMARQRAFFDRPRPGRLEFVTTAGVLQLVVGSAPVMEAQIAHLRAVDSGDEVDVRVLPFTNGVHAAFGGTFAIMDFDDPDDPSLIYLESLIGSRYVERVEHVEQFRHAFDRIRTQAVPLEEYLR
jgi:transcriptional regulator with XRE-family HTH domain